MVQGGTLVLWSGNLKNCFHFTQNKLLIKVNAIFAECPFLAQSRCSTLFMRIIIGRSRGPGAEL